MRPIIYPYKMGSGSARLLSTELRNRGHRALRVRPDGNYRPFRNHLIINWGNSHPPQWGINFRRTGGPDYNNVLNMWPSVAVASNKLTAFQIMQEAGVHIPEFTTDVRVAMEWKFEGPILARYKLSGHSGAGIEFVPRQTAHWDTDYDAVLQAMVDDNCPLYVKYIKKAAEYRVHVFRGEVIDIQQKMKRRDIDNEAVDYKVRNHANGWIYARDNITQPHAMVLEQANNAVRALGLDFGAVDIIWNNHYQSCYVLEVNTAPGLEGTTVTKYANAIETLL